MWTAWSHASAATEWSPCCVFFSASDGLKLTRKDSHAPGWADAFWSWTASFLLRQGIETTGHKSKTKSGDGVAGGELGNQPPDKKQSRPWLVFGVNIFMQRIKIVTCGEIPQTETCRSCWSWDFIVVEQIILKTCAFWRKSNALSPKKRKLWHMNKHHYDFKKCSPGSSHPMSPYLVLMQRPQLMQCCRVGFMDVGISPLIVIFF